jgi:hypothetical protein
MNNALQINESASKEFEKRKGTYNETPPSTKNILSYLNTADQFWFEAIQRDKVANCGQFSRYFQQLLYTVGLPTVKIRTIIQNQAKNRICSDHIFLVAGLNSKAKLKYPHTYGKHAVYLDAWWETEKEKGLFVPVREGLKKIKQAFQLDKKAGEFLEFYSVDHYCNDDNGYPFPKFATVPELPSEFKTPKP